MQTILQKLFDEPAEDAFSAILATYKREGFTIINFLYFANIVAQTLFETQNKTEKEREYKKILLKSDFLFPDGIAMQLFYACAKLFRRIKTAHTRLPNLNGTDFIPYFLSEIKRTYGNQKLCLLLYGTKEQRLEKAKKKLSFQGYNVIYAQDGYSDFNREAAETAIAEYQDTINLLLVGRSTPKIPLQELWTSRNYQKIQENQLIVFNS